MERYRNFIRVWYECSTLDEVCRRLGIDRRAASNIAATLRRYGVEMPRRPNAKATPPPHNSAPHDWPALRAWAEICAGQAAAERYRRGA